MVTVNSRKLRLAQPVNHLRPTLIIPALMGQGEERMDMSLLRSLHHNLSHTVQKIKKMEKLLTQKTKRSPEIRNSFCLDIHRTNTVL